MAVTLLTYGEQLAEVQTAISKVMDSQRYEIGGRTMQYADLEYLHKREIYLQEQLSRFGNVIPNMTPTSGMGYGVSFG